MKAAVIVAIASGAMLAPQIKPGVANKPVPVPIPASLTLDVQRSEAGWQGDIAVPEEWVTSMSIDSRRLLRFRFGIKQKGITLAGVFPHAEWRVYEGAPPVVDIDGAAANLIARGDAGIIPTILTPRTFLIDFGKNLLPAAPNGKTYFVNVVGRDHTGAFTQRISPYVALKYEASTFGTRLELDSLRVLSVVPHGGTLKGARNYQVPLDAGNSIEVTYSYELNSVSGAGIRQRLENQATGLTLPGMLEDLTHPNQEGQGRAQGPRDRPLFQQGPAANRGQPAVVQSSRRRAFAGEGRRGNRARDLCLSRFVVDGRGRNPRKQRL